jgi:putative chitinase
MPSILPPGFKNSYKKTFGPFTSDTEAGFEKLCREIENDPDSKNMPPAEIAYMIATVWWETYAPRTKQRFVPANWVGVEWEGDSFLYRNRGYVPTATHGKETYRRLSRALSTNDPEVLLGPGAWMAGEALFAYKILSRGMREGLFTGKKLSDFWTPSGSYNFRGARKIVGGNGAGEIAKHAEGVMELIVKGTKEKVA